jgi:hypothetical protein
MNMPAAPFAVLALLGLMLLAPAPLLALGARPSEAPAAENKTESAKPDDAEALAQYQVLREYFERQATLDDRMPEVFSRRVIREETMAFLAMRETVNRRGNLERIRMTKVDLSGLTFRRVTADPDLARIHVTGSYTISVPPVVETIEEDALFVLLPEMGHWKIFERREGWR